MKIEHVLVPLDQSALAEIALEYAVSLLHGQGALTLLTVVEKPDNAARSQAGAPSSVSPVFTSTALMRGMLALGESQRDRHLWENARSYLEGIANRLENPHLRVTTEATEGLPAEAILETAARLKVDAIVMSTHGRSGLSRWLLGSVAQKIVSAAACPVLLIPHRALQSG